MEHPILEEQDDEPHYSEETGLLVPHSALVMVFMTVFMDTISSTISMPVMPFYALSFGVSTAAIGYLYSAFSLAGFFGTPVLGRLSDKYGRRFVLFTSLIGAGIAALGQAAAPNFGTLLFFRAFSGIWGATMPIAKVYLGDICSYAVLPDYMAKLSQVPSFSRTMGPGLGGGLSKFGLNIPILLDGLVSFATAALVYVYLPESPAWEASKKQKVKVAAAVDDQPKNKGSGRQKSPMPGSAWNLCAVQAIFSIMLAMQQSMLAVSMRAKFGWDALHVGFMQMAMSIIGLCSGIWLSPVLSKRYGAKNTANVGTVLCCLGQFFMGVSDTPLVFLSAFSICKMGTAFWQSTMGTIQVRLTTPANRGTVMSTIGMFQKAGAALGPIFAGHVAVIDPKHWIWYAASIFGVISSSLLFLVRLREEEPAGASAKLLHGYSDIDKGDVLQDEVGTEEDYAALGKFMGDLLTARHYRWVSRREQVLEMLDLLVPEVGTEGERHKEDLARIIQHATCLKRALKASPPTSGVKGNKTWMSLV